MTKTIRTRFIAASILAAVIPAGLIARSYRQGADSTTISGFLATYLGDTLWPIMFYFIGRGLFPNLSAKILLLGTLGITLALEFGQLWNPPTVHWLRQQPIIGFILGNHFIWSDVICCTIGSCIAILADSLLGTQSSNNSKSDRI